VPGQAPLDEGPARLIGGYHLISRLDEGGRGAVYLARAPSGGPVAIKVLPAQGLVDPAVRGRLIKQVAAARRVALFCIAHVIEAQLSGDRPFIVSEYVEGPSLAEFVRSAGTLTGAALDRLAVNVATALVAIHQAHLVHGDLKPSNVILGPDGPRVIGFGIPGELFAEATAGGRAAGTPACTAPEQHMDGAVTPPADLFAWACLMTFAATGHGPLPESTTAALHQDPDLSAVPAPLALILAPCLDPDPSLRPTAHQTLLRLFAQLDLDLPQPDPSQPDPSQPDPSQPDPSQPDLPPAGPPQPNLFLFDPHRPDPPRSHPAQPDPAQPDPAQPDPAQPDPAQPDPAQPDPAQPYPFIFDPHRPNPPRPELAAAGGHHSSLPRSDPDDPRGAATRRFATDPAPPPRIVALHIRSGARPVLVAAALLTAVLAVIGLSRLVIGLSQNRGAVAGMSATERSPNRSTVPMSGAGPSPATRRPGAPSGAGASAAPTTTGPGRPTGTGASPATTRPGSPPSAMVVPAAFTGTWAGIITQPDSTPRTFPVLLTLTAGSSTGSISLPTLGCGGTLTVIHPAPTPQTLHLRHRATLNPQGRCARLASITLTASRPGTLSFFWQEVAAPTNTATAELTRS
jgi:serine/threonine protein kinase